MVLDAEVATVVTLDPRLCDAPASQGLFVEHEAMQVERVRQPRVRRVVGRTRKLTRAALSLTRARGSLRSHTAVAEEMNADLLRAIEEKRLVEFVYNDARRIVEPHDYGIRRGAETLLGYQLSGGSESGAAHGWKEFKLAKIDRLRVLDRRFPGSRGDSAQQHRTWETLFARVS
jgi:hypothetical protein